MSTLKPRYNEPGTSPGFQALEIDSPSAVLSVLDFSRDALVEERDVALDRCRDFFSSRNVTWVHVQGRADSTMLRSLAEAYELHPLAVEDVVNVGQRPKLETFDKQLFVILNWPRLSEKPDPEPVQVSLFLGDTYVVSFCDGEHDPFEPIRQRIRAEPPGRIRERGTHFLFYALLDLIIDQAFPVLDSVSERLEELEERILERTDSQALDEIHRLKRGLIVLRKHLWPQREVVNGLLREEHRLIHARTRPYLRDCYDHAIQILDLVETYREMASGLQDLYLTSLSNGMNQVMKVLTIIATIFMPLSFVAGVYGMNFDPEASPWNMPELGAYYGYPTVLGALVVTGLAMLAFFRRKGWM